MLGSMSPDLQRTLENYKAYDMIQELKTMFEEQAKLELFEIIKAFHACKQEDGKSVSPYLLKMKGYLDTFERLGYPMPKELGVSLILNSLNKDYDEFVQNYTMLNLHEKGIPKKAETPTVLTIRDGRIQKNKKKPQGRRSFWGYALESAARILNMVPTKKEDKTPYEIWNGKAPNLSYLKVWCYPKEMMGHYFYNLYKKKIFVARYAEFFRNNLNLQEASGSHGLLEAIEPNEIEPHSVKVPIHRSRRISQAPDIYGFYVDAEEHELGDLNEPHNYKVANVVVVNALVLQLPT
ncbi:hypothetical protein Tco_0479404 [Tanacetum coccineum]